MTRDQEKRLKAALEAKRGALIREINDHRNCLAIGPASDPVDQASSIVDRDLAIRNVARICSVLHLVEGALNEIRAASFGVCAKCGKEIPAKRLQAVPWSPYCISCQELAEQFRRGAEMSAARL
jgi:DnaK suppressor protein